MIDLDAYFTRIGFNGARVPSLQTLIDLHALHPAVIPFENLDPLLGNPVALDLDALERKLIGSRRGGYCFEHNTLFRSVLEQLGFAVTALSARVMLGAPPGAPPGPRSHMLLRVDLDDGAYVVDVGFGGYVATAPLRLIPLVEQGVGGVATRLVPYGSALTLQARFDSGWRDIYGFTLEPSYPSDYEIANWYMSTNPQSLFTNHLLLERVTRDVRTSALDRRVTRRFADGRVEETILRGPAELAAVFENDFGLEPPATAEAIFARLPV